MLPRVPVWSGEIYKGVRACNGNVLLCVRAVNVCQCMREFTFINFTLAFPNTSSKDARVVSMHLVSECLCGCS